MRGENPTYQTEANVRYLVWMMVEWKQHGALEGSNRGQELVKVFETYLGSTENAHLCVPEHILLLLLFFFLNQNTDEALCKGSGGSTHNDKQPWAGCGKEDSF